MSRIMLSVSELQFCDRDFLPDYMRPESERKPFGADAAETQRFYGAENDFEYLCSTATRQELKGLTVVTEEQLVGGWAELDADELDDAVIDIMSAMDAATIVTTCNIEPMHKIIETADRARRCRSRNGGRKVRRIHDSRETLRRAG